MTKKEIRYTTKVNGIETDVVLPDAAFIESEISKLQRKEKRENTLIKKYNKRAIIMLIILIIISACICAACLLCALGITIKTIPTYTLMVIGCCLIIELLGIIYKKYRNKAEEHKSYRWCIMTGICYFKSVNQLLDIFANNHVIEIAMKPHNVQVIYEETDGTVYHENMFPLHEKDIAICEKENTKITRPELRFETIVTRITYTKPYEKY